MRGELLIYGSGGEVTARALQHVPKSDELREGVGGSVEQVPMFETIDRHGAVCDCVAFCEEDGKAKGRAVNAVATMLWDLALRRAQIGNGLRDSEGRVRDYLAGDVIVVVGDAELLAATAGVSRVISGE
jgi:hypothetical protein